MNKKVIAAGMAMVLASMGLTACGDSGSKEAKDSSDETYTVTMAYIGDKEEDTDRIEKKINEIMKKDINMELDIEPISWAKPPYFAGTPWMHTIATCFINIKGLFYFLFSIISMLFTIFASLNLLE